MFREAKIPECALLLRRHGGILLTCDSIQHWANLSRCSLLGKVLTRGVGIVRPSMSFMHPANIGPFWRKLMTVEGGSLRSDFERLLELPFEHLIGGHGQPLQGGARDALRASVERVYG